MSDKQTKKLRKWYRKDLREFDSLLRRIIRPKPWFVPKFLYKLVARIVLQNIKL